MPNSHPISPGQSLRTSLERLHVEQQSAAASTSNLAQKIQGVSNTSHDNHVKSYPVDPQHFNMIRSTTSGKLAIYKSLKHNKNYLSKSDILKDLMDGSIIARQGHRDEDIKYSIRSAVDKLKSPIILAVQCKLQGLSRKDLEP
jgi:hypothetical protein